MRFTLAVLMPVLAMAVSIPATAADSKNQGYLTDRNGNAVTVRSSGCVRSRDWTPTRSNKQCESAVVATKPKGRS